MRLSVVSMFFLLALTRVAYAAKTVVQVYECPKCHKVAEYAEGSAKIHNCIGSEEKPHTKLAMIHRGKREIGK
jgi:hypothetical protein